MSNDSDKFEGAIKRGSLEDTFGFLLIAAWRDVSRGFRRHFRVADVSPQQYATLILVNLNPGCSTGDLSEPLGITANNIVKLVDDLAQRGFLAKTIAAHDRRVRILHLTPKGRDFLADLHAIHAEYTAEYEAKLGKANVAHLTEILRLFS